MASDAIALRTRMLYLRGLNLLGFVFVTRQAECAAVGVGQDNFSILCRLVAAVAHLVVERIVQECLHQLRLRRLVRVVALQAVRAGEWLVLMRLLQSRILCVMALDAQRRYIFLQVCFKLDLSALAVFVRDMAGVASHVERSVPAAILGNIYADVVAAQAEILFASGPGYRLAQLNCVVGLVRVVALHAIADCRRMDGLPYLNFLVVVAAEAEGLGCGSGQLDPGDIFVDPNFMTAQASGGDCRVNCLSFALIFVALETLRRVHILFKRYRVSLGPGRRTGQRHKASSQEQNMGEGSSGACLWGLRRSTY